MKQPVPDDERLSALLDGRLSDREREELLAHLAVPGDDLEVFAETAAILREMEAEDALAREAGTLPVPAGTPGTDPAAPEQPPPEAPPMRAYSVRPRPSAVRGVPGEGDGSETPDVTPGPVYSLPPRTGGWRRRAGILGTLTMLALAGVLLVRGRTPGVADPVQLAASLEFRGEELPADTVSLEGKRGPGSNLTPSQNAARAGAWVQAARVAVMSRDEEFFRAKATRAPLRELERMVRTEDGRRTLDQVRVSISAGDPPDLPALDSLLREITG